MIERVVNPVTEALSVERDGFSASGSVRYFPDSAVEVDVTVRSLDGLLKVLSVQVYLEDTKGAVVRSLQRFQVGSDGKVKGIPSRGYKAAVSGFDLKRAHKVRVSFSTVRTTGGSW